MQVRKKQLELDVNNRLFQIGKGVCQGGILSPCLFNFYAEYIMRNTGLEETQAGIKIAGRNINNLRYADGNTLMAESEEELKSPLMKVEEESERVGLRLNIQKTKITASGSILCFFQPVLLPARASSSPCFFQPSVSHDVLCIEVK